MQAVAEKKELAFSPTHTVHGKQRRGFVTPIALQRAAISDRHLPKYETALLLELTRQVREYAEAVASGVRPKDEEFLRRWANRLHKVKQPFIYQMTMAGILLSQEEMGIKSSVGMAMGKQDDPDLFERGIIQTGVPDDFLVPGQVVPIEDWIKLTSVSESRTSVKKLSAIFLEATEEGLSTREIEKLILERGLATSRWRAKMIARTGTIWSFNEGAHITYKRAGVTVEEWLTARDDLVCEFCLQIDGEATKIDDPFLNGTPGEPVAFPGTQGGTLNVPFPIGHPPLHPNCRCVIVPVLSA